MPTTCGHKDSNGYYCIWGNSGKHYYYNPNDKQSLERARENHERDPSRFLSPEEVQNRLDNDFFKGAYREWKT